MHAQALSDAPLARSSMTELRAARTRCGWWLLMPSVALLGLFVMVPIAVMLAYSFLTDAGAGLVRATPTLENWSELFTDPYYRIGLWQTVRVSCGATVLCALLGYPASYVVAMTRFRHKWVLLLLLFLPFWISYIIRTMSWIDVLGAQGAINTLLRTLHVTSHPLPMLYNEAAVAVGTVHFLLPYMILNIWVSLEGIDRNLILAARTLGCTPWRAFLEVTLPLSMPGLCAGLLLCFVLAAGSYLTAAILGGPGNFMFGNLIYDALNAELSWPMAATLSIILLAVLGCVTGLYARFIGLGQIYKGFSR
jgi:spermidine/putrescine transport system permease protein